MILNPADSRTGAVTPFYEAWAGTVATIKKRYHYLNRNNNKLYGKTLPGWWSGDRA
jgi:hypothetical protein